METRTQICPFLGTVDDDATACRFPTPRNVCLKGEPSATLHLGKQEACCLTDRYRGCARYMGRVGQEDRRRRTADHRRGVGAWLRIDLRRIRALF